ncbi:hypothetical protein QC823_15545 [Halomonas vilamensis]|uniref:Core-binding (CB) domain-containing protein n=1 Tax=Vreelandella vilamensis TaxID=531309 RepID=A0ABU1H7V5_9GAMM|nr:hypothetical protein [Halomonas vilamensis]MDR5900379.1 hypothetical protein [Halomonas vilamensis]
MSDLISLPLRRKIDAYRGKGGKRSRRATAARIERFVKWCNTNAEQIGRSHVHLFFEEKRFAPSTERDYFHAINKLWEMLGRGKEPPRPPSMR